MAEETDKENFEVVEWTIANFSCWNEEVHGEVIQSKEIGGVLGVSLKLQVLPNGMGDSLMVKMMFDELVNLQGVFSIIGPDGSIFNSCNWNGICSLLNFSGPRFNEAVALIRKNEALLEDRLILKLRMRGKCNKVTLERTDIVTIRSIWKISSPTLKNLPSGFNWISRTFYKLDDDSMGEMDLVVLRVDSEINLRLKQKSSSQKNVLVFMNVSFLGEDGAVLATIEKEHVFQEKENCMFWNSAVTKETEEDFSLIFRVKIVPSVKYKHQSGYIPTLLSRLSSS